MIYNNILETIGQSPLVRLNKITQELNCLVFAKCEFFNPGGSIKDRIAYNMILKAEKEGRIKKGYTLIEPTSGNTGVGLALAGAVLGYKVIIVMPEKMSKEKEVTLKALGAKIIRTPTDVPFNHEESHITVAKKIAKNTPNTVMLDQYTNPHNISAHYEGTAVEILKDLKKIDMIVMGAGTGGTLTGLSRKIREKFPKCQIIGVDPEGSILAGEGPIESYEVEGIGYDFIPNTLDRTSVTEWVKTQDKESFQMARRIIQEEGILVGGSCGSVMTAVMKKAHSLKKGDICVAIFADGIRNYMTKFVDDLWMREKQFI